MAMREIEVVTTATVMVDIHPSRLTPEALAEFSSYMWKVDTPEDLLKYAATQVAHNHALGEIFIEGIGRARRRLGQHEPDAENFPVLFIELEQEVECEVRS